MSRFFTTGSDSESESSVSGDELVAKPPGGNYGKPLLLSEDEEDTKRVVRSAKDKRFEELDNLIKTIRNAMKIRDVTKCLEEFELLGKAFGKAKSIVDKEGVPRFYVRILADLEDYLNEGSAGVELLQELNNRPIYVGGGVGGLLLVFVVVLIIVAKRGFFKRNYRLDPGVGEGQGGDPPSDDPPSPRPISPSDPAALPAP